MDDLRVGIVLMIVVHMLGAQAAIVWLAFRWNCLGRHDELGHVDSIRSATLYTGRALSAVALRLVAWEYVAYQHLSKPPESQ